MPPRTGEGDQHATVNALVEMGVAGRRRRHLQVRLGRPGRREILISPKCGAAHSNAQSVAKDHCFPVCRIDPDSRWITRPNLEGTVCGKFRLSFGLKASKKEMEMRQIIGAAAFMAIAVTAAPAAAQDYPYCLQGRQWGYPGNCQFTSYSQCQATASGTNAGCGLNPLFAYGWQPQPRRHRQRW